MIFLPGNNSAGKILRMQRVPETELYVWDITEEGLPLSKKVAYRPLPLYLF